MERLRHITRNFEKRLYRMVPFAHERQRIRELMRTKVRQDTQLLNAQLEQFERELLKEDRYRDPKNLNNYERQVFSQYGEDGIIAEIFRRIGTSSKTFVEIGVGDGLENNTTFLLLQGWNGYWIDGDEVQAEAIHKTFKDPIHENRLKIAHSFVTAENIANTFESLQVPNEFDFFSLDIDRNTYHIWEALSAIRPRAVVVEYNATIPPDIDWKVDYHAARYWNYSSYYGASLKAYENLGEKFGYCLVGCNLSGQNAFFVRKDLCGDKFLAPFASEKHYEPARYFLFRRNGHPAGFGDDE